MRPSALVCRADSTPSPPSPYTKCPVYQQVEVNTCALRTTTSCATPPSFQAASPCCRRAHATQTLTGGGCARPRASAYTGAGVYVAARPTMPNRSTSVADEWAQSDPNGKTTLRGTPPPFTGFACWPTASHLVVDIQCILAKLWDCRE